MKKDKAPEEISPEEKAKIEGKELPGFPDRKKGADQETPNHEEKKEFGPGPDEALPDEVVTEFCKDLAETAGQIWHGLDPEIRELEPFETKIVYKPMVRLAQKYRAGKYLKDEILLIGGIIYIVAKRLKEKKDAHHDSGKKGQGKDEPGQEDHPV